MSSTDEPVMPPLPYIAHPFRAWVSNPATQPPAKMLCRYIYDPNSEPYTVRIVLHADEPTAPTWLAGRDLLIAGLVSYTWLGDGPLRLRRMIHPDPEQPDWYDMHLPDMHLPAEPAGVMVSAPIGGLGTFLAKALSALPVGHEHDEQPVPDSPATLARTPRMTPGPEAPF